MKFEDLRGFINCLEEESELVRIKKELSPEYGVPAAMKCMDQKLGSAVMFEHVKGYDIPISLLSELLV